MLKIRHRIKTGTDSEVEILRFLTEVAHFRNSPPLLGVVDYVDRDENHTVLAILQTFMRNQGDAWTWTLGALKRILESAALTPGREERIGDEDFAIYVPHMRRLGLRTAEMHKALATASGDPNFAAEPLTFEDVRKAAETAKSASRACVRKPQDNGGKRELRGSSWDRTASAPGGRSASLSSANLFKSQWVPSRFASTVIIVLINSWSSRTT